LATGNCYLTKSSEFTNKSKNAKSYNELIYRKGSFTEVELGASGALIMPFE